MPKMLRAASIISLLLTVLCLSGCGLFGGSTSQKFQEPPPYYQAQREEMIEHARIYRQNELSRLEKGAVELETEKQREDAATAKKAKKKNWFGKGDETFLMSEEAKKINANFER